MAMRMMTMATTTTTTAAMGLRLLLFGLVFLVKLFVLVFVVRWGCACGGRGWLQAVKLAIIDRACSAVTGACRIDPVASPHPLDL